jgi:hypothetical protein
MTPIGSSSWALPVLASLGVLCCEGRAGAQAADAKAASEGSAATVLTTVLPVVGAALGPFWPLAPAARVGLAVDVTVGAAVGFSRRRPASPAVNPWQLPRSQDEQYLQAALWLQPEFGYSYERGDPAEPRASGHLGSLGLGVGYGSLLFLSGAYTPRLVAGFVGGELAVGLRHGLSGQFLGRLFSAELSHQLLLVGGELRHELRLLLGLNAGALLLPWL